jgi:signal transduction histidine kinase/CHASE2 domain-containing sensor protein
MSFTSRLHQVYADLTQRRSSSNGGRLAMRPADEWRQNATWGIIIGLCMALATHMFLKYHAIGTALEYNTLDLWFSLRNPQAPAAQASGNVVVLAIDRSTLRRWNGRVFDTNELTRLLQLLSDRNAASVTISWNGLDDTPLPQAEIDWLRYGIGNNGRVHLPLRITPMEGVPIASPPQVSDGFTGRFSVGRLPADGPPQPVTRMEAPPEVLTAVARGAGHTSFTIDADGRVRRQPVLLPYAGSVYPSLALSAAIDAISQGSSTANEGIIPSRRIELLTASGSAAALDNTHELRIGQVETPLFPNAQMLLNFPANPVVKGVVMASPFNTISVGEALDNPNLLRGVTNRCIIIGPTDDSVASFYPTPGGGRLPETMLHAIALDNMLTGRSIENAPELWSWLLTLMLGAIAGGFAAARPPLWSGVVVLLCLVAAATLSLGLFEQNTWLDISQPWLTTVLAFISGVIGRARRQERESTRIGSTIEALGQVGEIIATQREPEQVIQRILQWTEDIMRAEGASVLLFDEKTQTLKFVAATGPKAIDLQSFSLAPGEGIAGWVALHGEPAIVNDVSQDPRFQSHLADAIDFPTNAILCVPLRAHDKMLGVIEAVNRSDGQPFTQDDAELLSAVANQAALVLENARLLEKLNDRVVQSESDLAVTNQRLQAEKNTLQTVLQSMTDGVVVEDRREIVQMINPAAARLLDFSQQYIGRPLRAALPELDVNTAEDEATANGDHRTARTLQRGDPDSPRLLEARSAPLRNAEGTTIGTVWVFSDVTEERGIEQAKSDFVSFVAHEMRSPLTSISGFSSMLQRQELQAQELRALPSTAESERQSRAASPASRARFLGVIHNESERLTRLINSLLDVARIEAGRGIELLREPCDFRRIAREVGESQGAYSSRHRIVVDVPVDLPLILADQDKIAQILINLVSNALKFSLGGDVIIHAHAVEGFVEVRVTDHGSGIAPEQQAVLFERFGRIGGKNAATNTGPGGRAKPTGTGLGLFLTRHLVETHGGQIRVTSEADKGSSFIFTIPQSDITAEETISA